MTAWKSFGIVAVVALSALMLTAIATSPALAGKPDHANQGNGHGGGGQCKGGPKKCGGDTGTEQLTVTPNPVPLGSQSVDISGTGFGADEYLVVTLPGACCDMGATTDANGDFSVTFYRNFDWPSEYTVEVFRDGIAVASTTFTVQ